MGGCAGEAAASGCPIGVGAPEVGGCAGVAAASGRSGGAEAACASAGTGTCNWTGTALVRAKSKCSVSAQSREPTSVTIKCPGLRSHGGETTGAACLGEQSDGWTGRSVATQSWTGRSETAQSDARRGYMQARGSKGVMCGAPPHARGPVLTKRVLFQTRQQTTLCCCCCCSRTIHHSTFTYYTRNRQKTTHTRVQFPSHAAC